MSDATTKRRMRAAVEEALVIEATRRGENEDWIERERMAVVVEANQWALANGWPTITLADLKTVEGRAVGHVDYASKLALYACELVWSPPSPEDGRE